MAKNDNFLFPFEDKKPKSEVAQKSAAARDELHKRIWAIADDLRGAVDGWDFKNYVLGAMFYRYISENLRGYVNGIERDEDPDFDYADLPDEVVTE
ncbi:MAG: type I restriction-modification system subunit M N-terminal domain-containing protein, partial [Thermoguttaceae bacterium]|nr:type I restriction-modification system subunit M N-terminal domain-containing protein [Thermoguttaceae bacterium]